MGDPGTAPAAAGTEVARGMYGVRVHGYEDCDRLAPVPADWAGWRVEVVPGPNPHRGEPEHVGDDHALLHFGDGSTAEVFREGAGGAVRLSLTRPVPRCELAHPYLSVTGMLGSFWGDRLALHAGAFVVDGRAWLVVASKDGGKTTTLALLATGGYPVLADDLGVIGPGLDVHRGPRFVDLREEVADRLGAGEPVGVLGLRARWRHPIGDAPLTAPLGGFVIPAWGDAGVEHVRGANRVLALAPNVSIRVPGRWGPLMMEAAASVPVLLWRRPRDLDHARQSVERLLHAISV